MSRVEGLEGEDHDDCEAGAVNAEDRSTQRARRITEESWFDTGTRACRIDEFDFLIGGLRAAAATKVHIAIVAELADAHGSGPCTRKGVGVRVPPSAPNIFQRQTLNVDAT